MSNVRRASGLNGSLRLELSEFAAFLEEKPSFILVAFSIIYFAGTLTAAIHRHLWADEIVSLYISTQPAMSGVWTSLLNAVDGNPPLYYVMIRPFALAWEGDIAIRLPSLIGFWVAAIC